MFGIHLSVGAIEETIGIYIPDLFKQKLLTTAYLMSCPNLGGTKISIFNSSPSESASTNRVSSTC